MMTTEEIMQVALDLAGLAEIPADSGIYVSGRDLQRVLFGLDVGPADLRLARELGYDAVVAHHPMGARPDAWKVYLRHVDHLTAAGVPEPEARAAVARRLASLQLTHHSANYDHVPSVARLLGMPFLNVHLPCDELGRRRMQQEVDALLARKPEATVGEVAEALGRIPEVRNAATRVEIRLGAADAPAGRTVVSHGAYTNGGYGVATAYFRHGVGTVVYIHIQPEELARLREESLGNLVVVGHLAGDAIGINALIAELERRGLEVTRFAGVLSADERRGIGGE